MKCHPTILSVVLIFGLASSAWCQSYHLSHKHRHHVRRPIVPKRMIASVEASSVEKSDEEAEAHYEVVKAEVKADPRIQELKEESDSAEGDDAARHAAVAYYHALYQRIRDADKSLTERANRAEEAIIRRLNQ
jgi:hypothetical protein